MCLESPGIISDWFIAMRPSTKEMEAPDACLIDIHRIEVPYISSPRVIILQVPVHFLC